ncbi:MAG: hypothetical protein UX09_C0025G0007 [Candidatus Uhrbacteria bacterium GW2011_GWE2_45_35]|uniref:Uncharacterized protein n=2 Tax=Candidatus Uhriibacteriota TaxID=1752732 RepID=A0A0G1JDF7_9BACT|nr:MAG: hypothetical protein UW63_C0060G0007 [Candidatus Uhrbacteria bacterium GW2011_GWF2_44_350]KKU07717.1 MAG: hypothetical protein UX09_C0025G0007 [Candidatus Uhrbacteria bacterium GW2011_GWE2_45_35]HBR80997.1 hypothetical protein [Candidatus Uhrbacteria bacterium]HCU31400.1 hypothetical protein [Candidatus Uhrbacteria bacterium]
MNDIILGAAIGGLAAFLISTPAIVFEIFRRGKTEVLPLVVHVKNIFSFKLSQLAAFAVGVFLQILMGMVFGVVYPVVADHGWWAFVGAPYQPLTLFVYTIIVWLFFTLILFPIFGFGWFGTKEGKMVWLEVLVSLFLIALVFCLAVPFYQPSYF